MDQITEEESPVAVAVAVASIDDTVKQCNEEEIKKEKDGQTQTVQTPVVESHVCEIPHTIVIVESTEEKKKPKPQSLVEESPDDQQELIIRPEASLSLSLPDGTLPEKDEGHGKVDVQEPTTNTNKDAVALALACQLKRRNDLISSPDLFTCATTTSTSGSTDLITTFGVSSTADLSTSTTPALAASSTTASGEATQYGSLGEYFKSTLGSSKKPVSTFFGVQVGSWPVAVGSACFSFSQQRQFECASGTGSNSIIFGPTPPEHSTASGVPVPVPVPVPGSSPCDPCTSSAPSTSLEAEGEGVHSTVEQTAMNTSSSASTPAASCSSIGSKVLATNSNSNSNSNSGSKSWAAAVVDNFLSQFTLRQPTTAQTTPAFVSTNLLSAASASASASGYEEGSWPRFSDGFHARRRRRRAPRFQPPLFKPFEGRQWSWLRTEEKEQMAKSPVPVAVAVAVAVAVPLIQDHKVQQYSNKEEELNKGAEASCQLKRKGAFTSSSADMPCPKNAKKRKIDQTVLYNCTLCQVTVGGEGHLLRHLNGNRHQTALKRLAKLDINKQVDYGTQYRCTLNWTQL